VSKGMMSTTFNEVYCNEKNVNKQNAVIWQLTLGPG
jgi:hypothetical protein